MLVIKHLFTFLKHAVPLKSHSYSSSHFRRTLPFIDIQETSIHLDVYGPIVVEKNESPGGPSSCLKPVKTGKIQAGACNIKFLRP